MNVEETIREYYETLRDGGALSPYFLEGDSTTKFGVSESLFGYEDVDDALREQTESTAEWTVESQNLVVDDRGECAVFADEVTLAWTDTRSGERWRFDTRWSGTLERVGSDTGDDESQDQESQATWLFRTMHVSAPHQL